MTKSSNVFYDYFPLIVVTLLGLGLRIAYLSTDMLGWDEIIIYEWCRDMSFWQIMTFYENIGNHLLQTLLAKLFVTFVSDSVEGVRLPTLLIGTALIPVSYFFARDVLRFKYPIILSALIAGSSWEIFYSVGARGYEYQAFFACLQLLLTQKMLANPRSKKIRIGWFVSWVLHFYTLPTAVWFVVPLSLFTLIEWWRIDRASFSIWAFLKNQVVSYLIIGVIVGGLYALAVWNPDGKDEVAMFYPSGVNYTENYHKTIDYLMARLPDNLTWDFGPWGKKIYWQLLQIGLALALFMRPAFFVYFIALFAVLVGFNLPLKAPLPIRVYGFMSPLTLALCALTIDTALRLLLKPVRAWAAKPLLPAAAAAALVLIMQDQRGKIDDFRLANPDSLVGAKDFVAYMGRPENRGKPMLFIYPQYRYWSERMKVPLVSAQAELLPEIITTVRYHREGTEEVMARLTAKHSAEVLSAYDIKMDRIQRFGDVDVYLFRINKKQ